MGHSAPLWLYVLFLLYYTHLRAQGSIQHIFGVGKKIYETRILFSLSGPSLWSCSLTKWHQRDIETFNALCSFMALCLQPTFWLVCIRLSPSLSPSVVFNTDLNH